MFRIMVKLGYIPYWNHDSYYMFEWRTKKSTDRI